MDLSKGAQVYGHENVEIVFDSASEVASVARLARSEAALAIAFQVVQVPAMPVSTAIEHTKHGGMWRAFARADRSQCFLVFDADALE